MRVTRFYVGFPPAVVKRIVGETEYGIGLIPLGGFVRIVGMGRPRGRDLHACSEAAEKAAEPPPADQPDRADACARARAPDARLRRCRRQRRGDRAASESRWRTTSSWSTRSASRWCRKELKRVSEDADPRAYWRQATWRRIAAILAGPGANVLAALAILTLFYALGVPDYQPTTSVAQIQVNSPAQRMGLRPGDVVIGAQGRPVKDAASLRKTIETSPTVTLRVRRARCRAHARAGGSAQRSATSGCSASSSTCTASARCTSAPCARRTSPPRSSGSSRRAPGRPCATSWCVATAATSRASSASSASSRPPSGRASIWSSSHGCRSRSRLQPAAVPAAGRRSHPVRV